MKLSNDQRPSRSEIFQTLERLLSSQIAQEVKLISDLLEKQSVDQALSKLREIDRSIGGFGLHTLFDRQANNQHPYNISDRPLYRPIQYVQMHLQNPDPKDNTRYIVEMACAHVEQLFKEKNFLGGLIILVNSRATLGQLIAKLPSTYTVHYRSDLLWLNKIYALSKHDFNLWTGEDINPDLDEHLFALDEAIAIYLIARKLAVNL